jgi:hypothetical protein
VSAFCEEQCEEHRDKRPNLESVVISMTHSLRGEGNLRIRLE